MASLRAKVDKRKVSEQKGPVEVEETLLWRHLRQEDFRGACKLVQRGAPPDQPEQAFGWTPALLAANAGQVRLLSFLADKKAQVNASCQEGNTPLALAARRGHLPAVCLLISKSATVDVKNHQGWTALMWASMSGHLDVAEQLLSARASMLKKDLDGRNSCMWAARYGHQYIVEALLAKGLDATICDEGGYTAMDHAQDHLELKSAIILAEERTRRLLDAAQRDDTEAALQSIEDGAGCDVRDEQGWTPLTWAVLHDSIELASLLVRHGANPCLLGEETDLGDQVASPHLEVSDRISRVLVANDDLLAAAQARHWPAVAEALGRGAMLEAKDEDKRTALLWAARHGDVEAIKLLVERRASLTAKDDGGNDPMLSAALSGSIEAIALLHHCSAELSNKSAAGDSALHLAVRADDGLMIQVLLAARSDIEDVDYGHNTPLHLAALCGACTALSTLLNYGADPLAADHGGRTPLALAAAAGRLRACQVMAAAELEDPPALHEKWAPLKEESSEDSDSDDASVAKSPAKADGGGNAGGNGAGTKGKARAAKAAATSPKKGGGKKEKEGEDGGEDKKGGAKKGKEKKSKEKKGEGEPTVADEGASTLDAGLAATLRLPIGEETAEELAVLAAAEEARPAPLQEEDPAFELLRTAYERRDELIVHPRTVSVVAAFRAADEEGRTPVHLAVRGRHTDVLHLLLSKKAEVNVADAEGRTPLMDAVLCRFRDMVEELLEQGAAASILLEDVDGHKAADLNQDPAIGELLLKATIAATKMPRARAEAPEEPLAQPPRAGIHRVRIEQLPRQVACDIVAGELMSLCRSLGAKRPVHLEVVCDPVTDRPRGFAYLEFTEAEAADRVMGGGGREVCGCVIRTVRDMQSAMVR